MRPGPFSRLGSGVGVATSCRCHSSSRSSPRSSRWSPTSQDFESRPRHRQRRLRGLSSTGCAPAWRTPWRLVKRRRRQHSAALAVLDRLLKRRGQPKQTSREIANLLSEVPAGAVPRPEVADCRSHRRLTEQPFAFARLALDGGVSSRRRLWSGTSPRRPRAELPVHSSRAASLRSRRRRGTAG
jgi:hypothetical protein